MTPEQTLSALTELIVKALSDLQKPTACVHVHPCQEPSDCKLVVANPSFEHVLMAMEEYSNPLDSSDGTVSNLTSLYYGWDLGKGLREQHPETISFLYSVLKP